MLFNHQAKGFLACNPHDPTTKSHEAFVLTCGPNGNPCVRNCFELVRVNQNDGFDDDLVHYGQDCRLRLEPFSCIKEDAYMHSEAVTALAAAKYSRHQEVSAIATANGETKFQF